MAFRSGKHAKRRLDRACFATRKMPKGKSEAPILRSKHAKTAFSCAISTQICAQLFSKKSGRVARGAACGRPMGGTTGNLESELHVVAQAFHVLGGEVFEQAQIGEALQRSTQAAVIGDGLSLVIVDVGMALELVERQTVHGNLGGLVVDHKLREGLLGKIVDLEQLVGTVKTAQPLAVVGYLARKVRAYAGHTLQQCGVGGVEIDGL